MGVSPREISRRQRSRMEQPFESPRGSVRLFDCVKTRSELRPAFYFAFGDTLVADSLEQVALRQWRNL